MEFFCSQCGSKLSADTQFCQNCGASTSKKNPLSKSKGFELKSFITKYRKAIVTTDKTNLYRSLAIFALLLVLVFMFFQYREIKQAQTEAAASISAATQDQTELTQTKQQALQELASEQSQIQTLTQDQSTPSITAIVTKWTPIIAYVYCEYTGANGDLQAQSGSGTLRIRADGSYYILTNYHVVSDDNGNVVSDCSIKLPNDPMTYTAYTSDISTTPDTADVAFVNIDEPDAYLEGMTTQGRNDCTQIPNVGDEIVVLGYPGIGSPTNVTATADVLSANITATDGIISGYDGNYYVTSAKVAHGNSGGAAIDVADNCYLGIPTYVETDDAESLARILKWQAF